MSEMSALKKSTREKLGKNVTGEKNGIKMMKRTFQLSRRGVVGVEK